MTFNQQLYRKTARNYHRFMKACATETILRYVPADEFIRDRRILELGAGTGVFTEHLALAARRVYAVERSGAQLRILKESLQSESIRKVVVMDQDATAIFPFRDPIDSCFCTFSFDEIAGSDWGAREFDEKRTMHLLKLVESSFETDCGRVVLIGSMPERNLPWKRWVRNLAHRKKLFKLLRSLYDTEIRTTPYGVAFENHAIASETMGPIAGADDTEKLLDGGRSFMLAAYVALLRF